MLHIHLLELFVLWCLLCMYLFVGIFCTLYYFFCYPKKICFNVYGNHGDNLPSEIYQYVVIITRQDIQNYINLISIIFNIM